MTIDALHGEHTQALTHFALGPDDEGALRSVLHFQDGPVGQYGANGTTNEEVIDALVQRLESFQQMGGGRFACRENALAITNLQQALHWLWHRTRGREARGVAGQSIP